MLLFGVRDKSGGLVGLQQYCTHSRLKIGAGRAFENEFGLTGHPTIEEGIIISWQAVLPPTPGGRSLVSCFSGHVSCSSEHLVLVLLQNELKQLHLSWITSFHLYRLTHVLGISISQVNVAFGTVSMQ